MIDRGNCLCVYVCAARSSSRVGTTSFHRRPPMNPRPKNQCSNETLQVLLLENQNPQVLPI